MSRKFALLVIDMQEHFKPMASQILPEVNLTIGACRKKNLLTVFTQHGHKNIEVDGGTLAKFWGVPQSIEYGSKGWALIEGLNKLSDDVIIDEKRRYDAFYGTLLRDILRQCKVDTVVISGVMTNLCCETTARSAFVQDFDVIFLSDGTATNDQRCHDATLLNIRAGFGKVMSCAEFRKLIG